jgi:Na+-driven multidrug efflux pump
MGANSIYIWLVVGLIALIINFFAASLIAKAAEEKGRNFDAFFWLSFLFSWLIMAIVLMVLPPISSSEPNQKIDTSEYKECPKCAEQILAKASYCKHCHSEISPSI